MMSRGIISAYNVKTPLHGLELSAPFPQVPGVQQALAVSAKKQGADTAFGIRSLHIRNKSTQHTLFLLAFDSYSFFISSIERPVTFIMDKVSIPSSFMDLAFLSFS
jgi:hypothetical protein